MIDSFETFFTKKEYLVGIIFKEAVILECKEVIVKKKKFQKNGAVEMKDLCAERDQLINLIHDFLKELEVLEVKEALLTRR